MFRYYTVRPGGRNAHHPSRPMNAAGIAAALGERAEEVCRATCHAAASRADTGSLVTSKAPRGARYSSALSGPGVPGKWTDAATSQHGDLLDIIRHRSGAPTLRAALDEARAFLALPASPSPGEGDTYDASEAARRLWRRCRAIGGTHAEAYLNARGLTHCSFPALRFHPELFYRDGAGMRPAARAGRRGHGDNGVLTGVQRTWLDRHTPTKADIPILVKHLAVFTAAPFASGISPLTASLHFSPARELRPCYP